MKSELVICSAHAVKDSITFISRTSNFLQNSSQKPLTCKLHTMSQIIQSSLVLVAADILTLKNFSFSHVRHKCKQTTNLQIQNRNNTFFLVKNDQLNLQTQDCSKAGKLHTHIYVAYALVHTQTRATQQVNSPISSVQEYLIVLT
jgi:hypothetical protein